MRSTPACDTSRLVFCDWLQEEYPRGRLHDFIRAQVALTAAGWPPLGVTKNDESGSWNRLDYVRLGRPDIYKVYDHVMVQDAAMMATWVQWPLFNAGPRWEFARGFPVRVRCDWEHWQKWAPTITALGPVGEVMIVGALPIDWRPGLTLCRALLTDTNRWGEVVVSRPEYEAGRNRWGFWVHIGSRLLEQIWPDPLVESFDWVPNTEVADAG